jgi:hypothetical protein
MKNLFFLSIFGLINFSGLAQIQNPKIQKSEVPQCEIIQIGLTDSLTHIFFKYTNDREIGSWICAGENYYIKDTKTNKKYKLINSLNIPICPSSHTFNREKQVHYFSLSFEPLPKTTKEIDIIENPQGGFNVYGVSLEPTKIDSSINYVEHLEETPVKEYGSFLKDGKAVQYFIHNGFVIAMHLSIESSYGKYYTAYISIENYNDKRVDFYPENITSNSNKNDIEVQLEVLSYNQYMKKVNNVQAWNSFFVALGEVSAASKAGYSSSTTTTNASGYSNSSGYTSGYFGNTYGSVSSNVRTYGNLTSNSTSYNYDATANYYAQQNASRNIINYNSQQYSIKESIDQGYLKSNTIFSNQRINGYINIKFKKADIIIVTVPLNGENYSFVWNNN